eukprot:1940644-Pyramimonas_sp.AAC.1
MRLARPLLCTWTVPKSLKTAEAALRSSVRDHCGLAGVKHGGAPHPNSLGTPGLLRRVAKLEYSRIWRWSIWSM